MKRFLKWGLVLLASLIVILMCTAVVISYVNRPYARAVYDRIKRILDKDFYDHLYLGSSFEIINLDTMDIHSYMKKDQEELPASLSKLFTIDYALSVLSLDEQITISPTALDMQKADSSTAHLQEGDILSVYDIICAMVLPSGNDAAYSLAIYTGGKLDPDAKNDEERYQSFMKNLDRYLSEQGYKHTHFTDAAGYDSNDTTSAEDLTKVAAKLLKNDKFAEIVAKETYRAKSIKGNVYNWNTTNQFMQQDNRYFTERVKGVKTGSFDGRYNLCVYYTSSSDNHYLLVSFGSESDSRRYVDVQNLLHNLP